MVRLMKILCILLGLTLGSATGQDSDAIREDLKIVRDRRLTLASKVPAMESLLRAGLEGNRQLARLLGEELEDISGEFEQDAQSYLERFEAAAIRAGERKGAAKDQREIDELRDTILENARDVNLTKEQVVAESDPAIARLSELLHVSMEDVYAQDGKLTAEFFGLLKQLESYGRIYEYFERARAHVAESEDSLRLLKQIPEIASPAEEEARIVAEQRRLTLSAIPMREGDRRVLRENEQLADEIDEQEAAGILELNLIRIRCGLNALRIDTKLCEAGRDHSKDMKELDFFSHTSPVEGKETFGQRASNFGTSAQSENIARGQRTGKAAIDGWWHSPGHHRNMMAGASRIGIGRFEFHWTQLFG